MGLTRFGFNGLVFTLLMFGAFFAAPYSNLFFLLLAFLSLQWCACLFGAHRNLARIEARVEEPPPVPALTPVACPVRLTAPGSKRIELTLTCEVGGGIRLEARLPVLDGSERVVLAGPGLTRGVYPMEHVRVTTAHPFGMLRLGRAVPLEAELVVHPQPLEEHRARSASQALGEMLERPDPTAGDLQPDGLRDYVEGDEPRRIHWRASARRGELVVQEWLGGSGDGVELVLDRRAEPDALEHALRIVCTVAQLARKDKETLTVHSQELSATFGAGHRPWSELLRFLAQAEPLPQDGPAPPKVSPSVSRLPRSLAHA